MTSPDFSLIDLPGFLGDNIVAPVFTDGAPLPTLLDVLAKTRNIAGQRQDSGSRFWSTPSRPQGSTLREVMEVDLSSEKLVNRVQFELPHFPHEARLQCFVVNQWVDVLDEGGTPVVRALYDSNPPVLSTQVAQQTAGHPQHFGANHWEHYDIALTQTRASRFRLVLHRVGIGTGPVDRLGDPVDYSLGVRGFNIGYRVETRADIPADDPQEALLYQGEQGEHPPFASTVDILGSTITYSLRERDSRQLEGTGLWKCEPQPINYSVIPLYIRLVADDAEAAVFDRLYLEPLSSGPTLNIYTTLDQSYLDDPEHLLPRFTNARWTPINRDFRLRRGFYHVLPTKARWIKLEFSNLTPEPYDSISPVIRTVRLFPEDVNLGTKDVLSGNIGNSGLSVMGSLDATLRFRDNDRPSQQTYRDDSVGYTPTEVLHANDPTAADRLRDLSGVYNFHTWHASHTQPRFNSTRTHQYVETEIEHTQRVAYSVGLRHLEVFRLDYTADDDTEQYLDLFFDDFSIESNTGWLYNDGDLMSPPSGAAPWVVTSKVFTSRSPVIGVQYATTQTPAVQLLPDDDFNFGVLGQAQLNMNWEGVGDVLYPVPSTDYNTDIGTTVRVIRQQPITLTTTFPHTWRAIERRYHTWNKINGQVTYDDLNNFQASVETYGGIQSKSVITPAEGSRIYAAARVISPQALTSPLLVQIYDEISGKIVAEAEAEIPANQVVEWFCSYNEGDGGTADPQFWNDLDGQGTYADYSIRTWRQMEQAEMTQAVSLRARLVQRGDYSGPWNVDTLSMFEESIKWEFSNDGGRTFYPSFLTRNDPHGAFVFPQAPLVSGRNTWDDLENKYEGYVEGTPPTYDDYQTQTYSDMQGNRESSPEPDKNRFVWRVSTSRTGQHINGLSIRPWYGGALYEGGVPSADGVQMHGPNSALYDHYQPIEQDPRYRVWHKPIPQNWFFFYRQFLLLRHDNEIAATPPLYLDDDLTSGEPGVVVFNNLGTMTSAGSSTVTADQGKVDVFAPQLMDNFDYTASNLANANNAPVSDGNVLWTVGEVNGGSAIQSLNAGRRYFSNVGGGIAYSIRPYVAGIQRVDVDCNFNDAAGDAYIFLGSSISGGKLTGYALVTNGVSACSLVKIVNGVQTAVLATGTLLNSYLNRSAAMTATFDPSSGAISFKVEGSVRISFTDTSALTGNYGGLGGNLAGAQQFDNYNLPSYFIDDFYSASGITLAGRTIPGTSYTWQDLPHGTNAQFTINAGFGQGRAFSGFNQSKAFFYSGRTSYTIQSAFGGDGYGLIFRVVDANNYWYWRFQYGAPGQLIRVVAGAETVLQSYNGAAYLQRAIITPTHISLWNENTEIYSFDDSTHGSGTGVGIYGGLPPGGAYGSSDWFGISRT